MTPREQQNAELIRRIELIAAEAVHHIEVMEQTLKGQERISASLAEALDKIHAEERTIL